MAFYVITTLTGIIVLILGKTWTATMIILLLIILDVLYTIKSAATIEQNVLAGRIRLGKYVEDLNPGFYWIWWLFDKILEVTTETIESDIPAAPELIYHGDPNETKADGSPGDGVTPKGFTPALRVTFAEKTITEPYEVKVKVKTATGAEEEKVVGTIQPNDSFLKRQVAEVELSYGFKVKKGDLKTFYEAVGDTEAAKRNMNDHVTGGAIARLQRLSLAEAMLLLDYIADDMTEELRRYCDTWGIEVTFVRLKAFGFSHRFNKALSAAAASIEEKKETVTKSEGEEIRLTREGAGRGNAERSVLMGRADGMAKLADVAATPGGQFAMANETARMVAKESTLVVSDNGVLGGMAQIGKVLSRINPTPEPSQIILTDRPDFPTATPKPDREKGSRDNREKKDKRRK